MTATARERLYLFELFTDRDAAKELRMFQAAGFLRGALRRALRRAHRAHAGVPRARLSVALSARRGARSAMAARSARSPGCSARAGSEVATATTAAVAMVGAGRPRLSAMTTAVGTLVESGLFLDDSGASSPGRRRDRRRGARSAPRSPAGLRELRASRTSPSPTPADRARAARRVDLESRRARSSRWSARTARARRRWSSSSAGLYEPDAGRVPGTAWTPPSSTPSDVQAGLTVLFQDFVRYHLARGDNIDLGPLDAAARRGDAIARRRRPRRRRTRSSTRLPARLRDAPRPAVLRRPRALGRPVAAAGAGPRVLPRRRRS